MVGDDGEELARQVARIAAAGEADDREHAAGPQEVAHPPERGPRVHVMQGRDARDEVERPRREGVGEEVARDEVDARAVAAPRGRDARFVAVDAGHVPGAGAQRAGEQAFSAADVERALARGRRGADDDGPVVDVVVPGTGVAHGRRTLAQPPGPAAVRAACDRARSPGREMTSSRVGRMDYRTLGRTGVAVSPLCLGAMMFGDWGNKDHDDSVRIIHAALDAGINFIDTADVYARGESETIVGKALAGGRRDDVVLATKVHGSMGDDPNQFGNSRRWIIREVEASLKRLTPTGSTSTRSTVPSR